MSELPKEIRQVIEELFDVSLDMENIENALKWGLVEQGIDANIETVLAYSCGVASRAVIHASAVLHGGTPSKKDAANAIPLIKRRIDELRVKLMKERIFPVK